MSKAGRARQQQLHDRGRDAERLGHAVLDCNRETRERVSEIVLISLGMCIEELTAGDRSATVQQQSLDDLMRAMDRQGIAPPEQYRQRVEALLNVDKALVIKQRDAAMRAREERAEREIFERAWKERRNGRESESGMSESSKPMG